MPGEGVTPQNFVTYFHPEFLIFTLSVLFIRIVQLANGRHIFKSKRPFLSKNEIDLIVLDFISR